MPRKTALTGLMVSVIATIALANEVADPNVVVDTSVLPPVVDAVPTRNPYRGNPNAVEIGHVAFNQACSRCHGVDAENKGHVGPDLTLLDRACGPIADPQIKLLCLDDNDVYFFRSVQEGKVRVGVTHMPAWKQVLSPAAIWTIRSYLESRRRIPKKSTNVQ